MDNKKKAPAFKLKWYWNLYHKFFEKDITSKILHAQKIQRIITKSTSPGILHFFDNKGNRIRGMVDGYNVRYTPDKNNALTKLAPESNPLIEKYGYQ